MPLASRLSPRWQIFLQTLPRALFHDMTQGDLTLRAMGLVYTTLLSLAPLLALGFSVLKGFGVHNRMEPLLVSLLSPMGDKAEELTRQILGFVDNVQVGVLGVAGLTILLYTVISLMQKIEEAFNHVWRVPKSRSLTHQFRDYLSVVMVGPILLFSALGMWSAVSNTGLVQAVSTTQPFGLLLGWLVSISPALLMVLSFTFLYLFMPNTRVQPTAALTGAIVAGVLWQVAGKLFAAFVVSSGQQTAIYSVFASLFLFMLWLYVAWIIVLSGARLAYYLQYPDAVYLHSQPSAASMETREVLAATLLGEVGRRFLKQRAPPTLDELHESMPVSRFLLQDTLEDLINYGILSRDDGNPARYLLRVSPDRLTVEDIRRSYWQGDTQQQHQAQQVRQQLGLPDHWLAAITGQSHLTVQQLLEQHHPSPPLSGKAPDYLSEDSTGEDNS